MFAYNAIQCCPGPVLTSVLKTIPTFVFPFLYISRIFIEHNALTIHEPVNDFFPKSIGTHPTK